MKRYRFFITGILICSIVSARAQSSDDFGIWSSVEIEKKFNKKWALNGELELRTRENTSEIGRWGAKLGGEYALMKEIKVGLAYQFQYFHDIQYQDFQPRNRFIGYLQGRKKWNNFVFTLRERFQVTTKDDSDRIKENGKIDTYKMDPEWCWRNRIKLAYDIPKSKFTPAFSFETFYQLNNPDGNEFDGFRYTLSLTYKLNKRNAFELSGIYDREVNVNNPVDRTVLGAGYSYSF